MTTIKALLGVEQGPASLAERVIAALGGLLAIYLVARISAAVLGDAALPVVASMGASTVLLFAVPHGPLSQPWALVGGNLVSAIIGVACARWIGDSPWAAGLAVGLAIAAMHTLRCIHPPGGATALAAVISGPGVHELGFSYVLAPVTLNVSVLLVVAVLVNALFAWRRYPAALVTSSKVARDDVDAPTFSHRAIAHAMKRIDSFVDVTEDDLNRIFRLASEFEARERGAQRR